MRGVTSAPTTPMVVGGGAWAISPRTGLTSMLPRGGTEVSLRTPGRVGKGSTRGVVGSPRVAPKAQRVENAREARARSQTAVERAVAMTNKMVQMYLALGGMFEAAGGPPPRTDEIERRRKSEECGEKDDRLPAPNPVASPKKTMARKMVVVRGKWRSNGAVDDRMPYSRLGAYMRLPLEEYNLLDESMIERLPHDTTNGEQLLRLTVPMEDTMGLRLSPSLDVAVKSATEKDRKVVVSSRGFTFGNELLDREGTLEFSATLTWGKPSDRLPRGSRANKRGGGKKRGVTDVPSPPESYSMSMRATKTQEDEDEEETSSVLLGGVGDDTRDEEEELKALALVADRGGWIDCDVKVRVTVNIPRELRIVPGPVISATGGLIADATLSLLLPKFIELLVQDASRWARGEVREALISSRKLELASSTYGVKSSSTPAPVRGSGSGAMSNHASSSSIDLRQRTVFCTFRERAATAKTLVPQARKRMDDVQEDDNHSAPDDTRKR